MPNKFGRELSKNDIINNARTQIKPRFMSELCDCVSDEGGHRTIDASFEHTLIKLRW